MKNISYIDDFQKWEAEFSFFTEIKVRFSETDMFGHVNNVTPFIYFEQARIEYLQHLGIFSDMETRSTIPIVADLQCDYVEQVFFPDELKVYVKAQHIGNTSIDIHYLGKNKNGRVCFTGRGRLVNIDVKSGKPTPFTKEEKEKMLHK